LNKIAHNKVIVGTFAATLRFGVASPLPQNSATQQKPHIAALPTKLAMAINKKGSRKIVVGESEFRWRATGNDGWISVVIWPVENENSRYVGSVGYHGKMEQVGNGWHRAVEQTLVTNRVIRALILRYGVNEIIANEGQVNIGPLEKIIDINLAKRADLR